MVIIGDKENPEYHISSGFKTIDGSEIWGTCRHNKLQLSRENCGCSYHMSWLLFSGFITTWTNLNRHFNALFVCEKSPSNIISLLTILCCCVMLRLLDQKLIERKLVWVQCALQYWRHFLNQTADYYRGNLSSPLLHGISPSFFLYMLCKISDDVWISSQTRCKKYVEVLGCWKKCLDLWFLTV